MVGVDVFAIVGDDVYNHMLKLFLFGVKLKGNMSGVYVYSITKLQNNKYARAKFYS